SGFLFNLPNKVQSIITTRERVAFYSSISLDCLPEEKSLELIKQQAEEKGITLSKQEKLEIYHASKGVPLASLYATGCKKYSRETNSFILSKNLNLLRLRYSSINEKTCSVKNDIKKILNSSPDCQLLIIISFFPYGATFEAIAQIIGCKINTFELDHGIEKLKTLSLIEQDNTTYFIHPITRKYVAQELGQYHDVVEKKMRNRWVKWHLAFAKKYGGRDWENWKENYNQLDKEWSNLLAVLEWCSGKGHYQIVRDIWQNINQFANLYGYWNARIFWLGWLIEESKKRGYWKIASYFISEKGFTLIQMGELPEAEDSLNEALDLMKAFGLYTLYPNENFEHQTLVCQHFALLSIEKQEYHQAFDWLEEERESIELMKNCRVKKQLISRRKIAIDTLEAEIFFRKEEYKNAEDAYKKVRDNSAQIGWHRRKNQAQERIRVIKQKLSSDKLSTISQSVKKSNRPVQEKRSKRLNSSINLYG
ncbi:MAG: hypothetical protein AAGA80_25255, partial [Cyanobacteria bacterium P01_F01_bin.143]